MTTYKDVQRELERLHQQSAQARLAEKAAVLERIRALIIEHELLPHELGFVDAPNPKTPTAGTKYRDPLTGATWSGRGRPPRWLDGTDRSKFIV